jgi:cell division protein FtsW (lipid II flippase)
MTLSRRNTELTGLLLVGLIFVAGTAIGRANHQGWTAPPPETWLFPLGLLIVHLIVRFAAPEADPVLLPVGAFLTALGLIELGVLGNSMGPQELWVLIGLAGTGGVLLAVRNPDALRQYKYLAGVLGVALLLSPVFFGTMRGGSKLWLVVGGYSFQPLEPAKILLTIFLAAYLAEKKEVLAGGGRIWLRLPWPQARHFGPLVLMWAVSLTVLILSRDLGSSLIFFGLFLTLIYLATGRLAFIAVGSALFVAGTAAAYRFFPHVAARFDVWIEPLPTDVSGSSYQVAQSLFALAGGGLTGTGLGAGLLGREISMPALQTDFIFSALGEELGLAGAFAILLSYLLILARSFQLSVKSRSDFTKLLAAGLATVTGVQAIVIIAGVIKLAPLTGVTLPFVSYGGSSILSSFLILGLLLAISRQVNEQAT